MGCASSAPAAGSAAGSAGPQSAPPQGERLRASSLKRLQQELWQCAAQGELWDDYDLGPVIGTGTFAVVRRAVHRATGDVVAVKILRVPHELAPPQAQARSPSDARRPPAARPPEDGAQDAEDVIKEVAVLRCLDSPYTCRLHSFYLASDALYLVTDFCAGGQLLHALLAKGTSGYSEHDCRTAFTALLRALCYLHARGVTHRDVKLDNVLLAVPGDLSTVRLVDFGLAASCLDEEPDAPEPAMTWMCGSAPYMAPEVALRRIPYTDACDMWSAGVVLHLLLTGHMPFAAPAGTPPDEEDEAVLAAAKSVHWQVTCDAPEWTGVSEQAKALTRALLEPEPSTRLSAAQALLHPWVGGDAGGGGAADLSGALSRLTRFVAIADLPSVKLPPGTLLTADGTFGGPLFAMDGGAFLIKTGRVDVLVPAEEGSPLWPPSSSSTPTATDDGMRPLRRVGSRGAGELVGELSMMHVDGSGKVTWGAHHAGEGSGRHVLTPSLSRKSSGSRPLAAGGEAGSVHGSSAGGSRHAESGGGEASLADGMAMEGSAKGMQLLRTAFLRTATPVEVVPLPRADLEWALAQDAHMAQQVARFVTSASHHDLQAVLAPN